ncbi:SCO family protein [Lysobacter enzymogenes]|uniref:SCO family protein n=1 Tax=Lysobacter enzymogenes TaxID=69 RepID=UPI001A97CC9B|nr:SCO family protein [Lysobacter enzymogenes]QQP97248.1 SCO family protein [Lysobacter enzymogenes]
MAARTRTSLEFRRRQDASSAAAARPLRLAAALLWLVAALAAPAAASADADPHAAHRAAMAAAPAGATATTVALPGVRLRQRDGSELRLDAQAFGDRVVVVDFVFTNCTTICPALTAIMGAVQTRLQRDGAGGWQLLSLSVDPARDTPARMDDYARKVGAGERWWWLTGERSEVERGLRAFGVPPGPPEEHAPMVLVGHPASGRWLRWVGMPDPQQLAAAVRQLRERAEAGEGAHAAH